MSKSNELLTDVIKSVDPEVRFTNLCRIIDNIEQTSKIEDALIAELKHYAKGNHDFDDVIDGLEKQNKMRHDLHKEALDCIKK